MKEFLGALVALGTAFIGAGIVYQTVKPGSQGPVVTGQITSSVVSLSHDLFKS